jgi:hypothetical protein
MTEYALQTPEQLQDKLNSYLPCKTEYQMQKGPGNPVVDDNFSLRPDNHSMNDMTREELSSTLSALEERMDKRIERMERDGERRSDDYRKELALRDDQLRRELDLRQESFRLEQAARDAALSERFSGFLAAQAERDKAWEKISESRLERIEKDVGSIKADTKKVGDDVNGIKVTMGKYLGGAIVIGAIASALLGVALRYVFTLSGS